MRLTFLTISAAVVVAALGTASPALACSCAFMSEEEHLEKSDLVFEGTVVKTRAVDETPDGPWRDLITKFMVTRTVKGDEAQTREIHHHRNNGANCGINFEDERAYRVYAHRSESGFSTNSCSNTQPLEK